MCLIKALALPAGIVAGARRIDADATYGTAGFSGGGDCRAPSPDAVPASGGPASRTPAKVLLRFAPNLPAASVLPSLSLPARFAADASQF
jgi:hypothetical protein